LMDPARRGPHAGRNILKKCDNVVIGALLNLVNLRRREAGALPNFHRIGRRDFPDRGHRFAGENFDLEPDLEFPLLRPKVAHGSAGITINHCPNIEKTRTAAKRFVQKRSVARADDHRSDAAKLKSDELLADPGATELSVTLYAHLTTAEKIGHRGDRFFGVFGAGTDCENEIAERELGARLED